MGVVVRWGWWSLFEFFLCLCVGCGGGVCVRRDWGVLLMGDLGDVVGGRVGGLFEVKGGGDGLGCIGEVGCVCMVGVLGESSWGLFRGSGAWCKREHFAWLCVVSGRRGCGEAG